MNHNLGHKCDCFRRS